MVSPEFVVCAVTFRANAPSSVPSPLMETTGAPATGETVTVKFVEADAVSDGRPVASSITLVVTFRSTVPCQPSDGVKVKFGRAARSAALEKVQVPSLLSVPALNVAPDGTPEITTDVMLSDVSPAAVSPVAV